MNKVELAVKALRDAADAYEAVPVIFKPVSLLPTVTPHSMRNIADLLESKAVAIAEGLADSA